MSLSKLNLRQKIDFFAFYQLVNVRPKSIFYLNNSNKQIFSSFCNLDILQMLAYKKIDDIILHINSQTPNVNFCQIC